MQTSKAVANGAGASYYVALEELSSLSTGGFGNKALNCARMKAHGLPVPDGIAVRKSSDLAKAASALKPRLETFSPQTRFAVRSSALMEDGKERSFAGMFESELNVPKEGLHDAMRRCFDAFSSDRVLAYTAESPSISADGALLIQEMVNAQAAGVAFTAGPFGASDEMLINAAWGIGDSVVGGFVDPDEYRLSRKDGTLVSQRIGEKKETSILHASGVGRTATPEALQTQRVLTCPQLSQLFEILEQIEKLFGCPQDVEWCFDGTHFWIVQARTITTHGAESGPCIEWTRAHFRETLPDPTAPQTLEAMCRIIDHANRRFYRGLVADECELGPLAKAFHGRVYLNLSQMRRVCLSTGTPPAEMLQQLGYAGEITPEDQCSRWPGWKNLVRAIPSVLRTTWWLCTLRAIMRGHFQT